MSPRAGVLAFWRFWHRGVRAAHGRCARPLPRKGERAPSVTARTTTVAIRLAPSGRGPGWSAPADGAGGLLAGLVDLLVQLPDLRSELVALGAERPGLLQLALPRQEFLELRFRGLDALGELERLKLTLGPGSHQPEIA